MAGVNDLYQRAVLDHNSEPRNYGEVEGATHAAELHNTTCGDSVALSVRVDGALVIAEVKFRGEGCAIMKASASMMTEAVKGLPVEQAGAVYGAFSLMLTSDPDASPDVPEGLLPLAGVRQHRTRLRCAALPWLALAEALAEGGIRL